MEFDAKASSIELEDGEYGAICATVELDDYGYGEKLQFTFELQEIFDADGEPITRKVWANPLFTPASKAWGLIATLTGKQPTVGGKVETDTCVNRPCRVIIKNDPGPKIVEVMAPKAAA